MSKRRQSQSPASNQSQVSPPKRRQTDTIQSTPPEPKKIYPPRQTRAQAQSSATSTATFKTTATTLIASTATNIAATSTTDPITTIKTTKTAKSSTVANAPRPNTSETNAPRANPPRANPPGANAPRANAPRANAPRANVPRANAPRASTPSVNAPIANTFSASAGASSIASASSASVTVKAPPKRHTRRKRKSREITEVAQEKASTLGEDEYESENDQPDGADENVSVSGSERSASEMIIQSKKAAKGRKNKAILKEKYLLAAKELVYDTFMLGVSQNFCQASLTAIDRVEEEAVANLQSSSSCLADNTRDAYRIVFSDYKKFCDVNFSSETFRRYEVAPPKALAYLRHLFAKRTPKHIGPDTKARRIRLDRDTVILNQIPIEGASETVNLVSYVDAEEAAGRVTFQQDGRRTIFTPYSYSKIEQGYAALNSLQKLQQARSIEPNTSPSMATCPLIKTAMEGYDRSLVGGIFRSEHVERDSNGELISSGRDVSTNSNATNYYTVAEHIRCLLYAWRQPINSRSIMIREHFVLAVRHSMLLRDENARYLDISDCSMDTFVKQPGGTQEVVALVFSMRIGKANKNGNVQLGMAVRHTDVRRCSVGAFAFYMFERFQVKGEPWLNMDDPEWTTVKVLGQGEKEPMDYSTARDATLSVLNSQHVSCTNITHSGRHSGAKEAVRLKVAEEDIRTGGRWVHGTGKMHQVYLDKQPITFALAMAGFSIKPFHLRRNEVSPSLPLQRLIFPFIEEAIGAPGSFENEQWRKECDLEMQEFDPNNNDNLDDVEPYAFEPNPKLSRVNKATALARRSNKKHVLRLMLRLRRVLLQDAAEYLHRYPDIALSPLLEKCPEVFESPMFEAFKEDVTKSLKRLATDAPTDLPPNLMVALQAWNLAQTNGVGDIRRALADIHVRLDAFEECFTTQHDQNNWVNDGLDGIEKMHREIQKALDRPPPVGLQPYFAGVQPFFGHGIPGPISSPPFQHQQLRQSTAHPGSQRLPPPKPGNHQSQAIRPALSALQASPTPIHTTRRSRPPGSLPASFRRQKESEAVQRPKNSEAGDIAASTGIQTVPVQAKDWFVPTNYPTNTKAVFEELERYDNLRTERRVQGLPTTLSGAATKNLNNKRRIQEQVLFLMEKDRKNNKSSKEEALIAAFREIDAVALPAPNRKNRYNFYPCVEYCKRQKQAREREGSEKASKGKEKKQDDEEEQDEDGEEEE